MKNSGLSFQTAPLQLHPSQLALVPVSLIQKYWMKGIFMLLAFVLIMMTLQGCDKDSTQVVASDKSTALNTALRVLWSDHAVYTRNVIFNIIDGAPGTTEAVNRLLQNQVDLGNAIKPYYGDEAGNKLTVLLKEHITIAAGILTAAKTGNTADYDKAMAAWYANGDDIAIFLSTANPENWKLTEWKAMMKTHLDLTLAEAVARLHADYAADITAYDKVYEELMMMSDMIAKGLTTQFPDKM